MVPLCWSLSTTGMHVSAHDVRQTHDARADRTISTVYVVLLSDVTWGIHKTGTPVALLSDYCGLFMDY